MVKSNNFFKSVLILSIFMPLALFAANDPIDNVRANSRGIHRFIVNWMIPRKSHMLPIAATIGAIAGATCFINQIGTNTQPLLEKIINAGKDTIGFSALSYWGFRFLYFGFVDLAD